MLFSHFDLVYSGYINFVEIQIKQLTLLKMFCLWLCYHASVCVCHIWSITDLSGQQLAADSTLSPTVCHLSFILSINVDDELVPQVLCVTVSLFY